MRDVLDVPMQRGARQCRQHKVVLRCGVRIGARRVVECAGPCYRVGREWYFETTVGEVDACGDFKEPLGGVEEERYELDQEWVACWDGRDGG